MPIYESQGKRYNIPSDKVDYFLLKRSDARLIEQPKTIDVNDIAGEKTFAVDGVPLNKAQQESGFWNTKYGDFVQKLGAGTVGAMSGLSTLSDLGQNIPLTGTWALKKAAETITGKEADVKVGQELSKTQQDLSEKGSRYGYVKDENTGAIRPKKYTDLLKEGDYLGAAGDVMLTAAESIPTTLLAMSPGGLATVASSAAGQKYQQLNQDDETKDLPEWKKWLNASASGAIEGLTEKLGAKVDMKMIEPFLSKMTEKTVKEILAKGGANALIQTVTEGAEEVLSQLGGNVVDYATNETSEYKPFEGVQDAFVYGAGGGAQFGGVTMLGASYRAAQSAKVKHTINKNYKTSDSNIDQNLGEESKDVKEYVKDVVDSQDNAKVKEFVDNVNKDEQLTKEQKAAITNYVSAYADYKEANNVTVNKVKTALQNIEDTVKSEANETTGTIMSGTIGGKTRQITKGNIVQNEDGTINKELSDKEIYYKDDEGKVQVVPVDMIDNITENIAPEDAIMQVSAPVVEQIQAGYENEVSLLENDINTGEQAYYDPYGNGVGEQVIINDISEDGYYIVTNASGATFKAEPRVTKRLDSGVIPVENESVVMYTTPEGSQATGTVTDAYGLRNQGMIVIDGNVVPVENVIGLQNVNKNEVENIKSEGVSPAKYKQNLPNEQNDLQNVNNENIVEPTATVPETTVSEPDPFIDYPRTKKGDIDFDVLTPAQQLQYAEITAGEEFAVQQASRTVKGLMNNLEALSNKLESETNMAKAANIQKEIAAIDEAINTYKEYQDARNKTTEPIVEESPVNNDIKQNENIDAALKDEISSIDNTIIEDNQSDKISVNTKNKELESEKVNNKSEYGASNKLITTEQYEILRKQLRSKLNNTNVGFDPELFSIGTQVAMYHIESGTRKFIDFAIKMIDDIGENIKPYLKSFYEGARFAPGMENIAKDMDNYDNIINFDIESITSKTEQDVYNRTGDSERNSNEPTDEIQNDSGDVPIERGESGENGNDYSARSNTRNRKRKSRESGSGIFTTAAGEQSDNKISDIKQEPIIEESDTRIVDGRGSIIDGADGLYDERKGNDANDITTEKLSISFAERSKQKLIQQKNAESIPVKILDRNNIEETLPFLLPEQQDDVYKAENRFFSKEQQVKEKAFGKGILFTNGTGTGKTYTGLGIVKRFSKQGKNDILIVVPTQPKVTDWISDGKNLGLNITALPDTSTGGKGITITTYANFRSNRKLKDRVFDLVMYDESHRLMEDKNGNPSETTFTHYEITNRDEQYSLQRLKANHPLWIEAEKLQTEYNDLLKLPNSNERNNKLEKLKEKINENRKKCFQEESILKPLTKEYVDKTKVVFLSATPFKSHFSLRYANKYLFDWGDEITYQGYSRVDPESRFFLDNFGGAYEWKYHRLQNKSNSNADAIAMNEIDFAEKLMKEGAMSGRSIESNKDYAREFPKVSGLNTELINKAFLDIFNYETKEFDGLRDAARDVFYNHNYSTQLFESLKSSMSIPRIEKHLELGRKVVVFHRRKQANASPPFESILQSAIRKANESLNEEYASNKRKEEAMMIIEQTNKFRKKYADLLEYEKTLNYNSAIDQISAAFGNKVALINGDISKKEKDRHINLFNDDNSGVDIIVIQEESGKEGISLHDKSGNHQRVLISLSMPNSSVTALQIEGRIYRLGQESDAIFEYPLLGLDMEVEYFGRNINKKLSTTENLAMGGEARDLIRSFAEGVLFNSDINNPHTGQGKGGKEYDKKQKESLSEYRKSVLVYNSNQKQRGTRDQRAGIDYYPTPEPIGQKMIEWLHLKEGETALEPSAGHGAIAMWFPNYINITAIEPSFELYSKLNARSGGGERKILNTTFEDFNIINKFDGIAMNPPFGVGGKTAVEHIEKAFKHLRPNGRIVAIIPDGVSTKKRMDEFLYGKDEKDKLKNPEAVLVGEIRLPPITFNQAGTQVNSKIVIIDKVNNQNDPQYPYLLDYSKITKINDLFDAIEFQDAPERNNNDNYNSAKYTSTPSIQKSESVEKENKNNIISPIEDFTHTQSGKKMGLAKIGKNLNDKNYEKVKQIAKKHGGYWSQFAKGMLFESKDKAIEFMDEVNSNESISLQYSNERFIPISDKQAKNLIDRLKKTGLAKDVVVDKAAFDSKLDEELNGNVLAKQELSEMESIKQNAIDNGTFMLAPNGNPTKLTESQWLQVRTKAFKDWFGDWINDPENASKVVDENGEPMVVYHGSRSSKMFNIFSLEKSNKLFNGGIYFSDSKEFAKKFSLKNGVIFTAYLKIVNPYRDGFDGAGVNSVMKKSEYRDGGIFTKRQTDKYANKGSKEYIVFEPTQIKSAISNVGTFDPNNPDIRMQVMDDIQSKESPHRYRFPKVRGGWTKPKILKSLKEAAKVSKFSSGLYNFIKEVAKYDNVEELKDNIFYHGTGGYVSYGLKPSITLSERGAERMGGGGYGERYWSISVSKSKRVASIFFGQSNSVSIYPVILRKGAKVVDMPNIEDSAELEDIIEDLWNQGVDAVRLGDWSKDHSEQELAVLNPYAIVKYDNSETHGVYGLNSSKFTNPTDENVLDAINKSKSAIEDIEKWKDEKKLDSSFYDKETHTKEELEERKKLREEYKRERSALIRRLTDDIRFLQTNGTVYGFVSSDGVVYLNPERMNANTPIHEFGHLWNTFTKKNNPELYNKGAELVKESEYWQSVNNNPAYMNLSDEAKIDEAMAMAIGDKGESVVNSDLKTKIKKWLSDLWKSIKSYLGINESVGIENMTLSDFSDMAVSDLLGGKELSDIIKPETFTQQEVSEMEQIKEQAIKDGTFMKAPNGNDTNLNERQWLQVRTTNFKNWFGDWEGDPENASKVVDENGEPKVVFHGTTHQFYEFKKDRGNIENHFGIGYYFTDSKIDAENNYLSSGADISNRIERLTEIIVDDEGIDYEEAKQRAIDELSGGDEIILDVYLNIKYPMDVRPNGLVYDASDTYDEETDEYIENEESLPMQLYNALNNIQYEFDGVDAQSVFNEVSEAIGGVWDGVSAYEVDKALRSAESVMYIEDNEGNLSSHEFIRSLYDEMGFDGIIMDADIEFGNKRKYGKVMDMDDSTLHYIAFSPTQIKSAEYNTGSFDSENPDIRYQQENDTNKTESEIIKQNVNSKIHEKWNKFRENWEDAHLPVKIFIDELRNSGVKIHSSDDFYQNITSLSGKNDAELKLFHDSFGKNMLNSIAKIISKGKSKRDIENYVMLKHGIERNEHMRKEEVNEFKTKLMQDLEINLLKWSKDNPNKPQDVLDEKRQDLMSVIDKKVLAKEEKVKDKDYSGYNAIDEEVGGGLDFINQFEKDIDKSLIDGLWDSIKNATEFSINKLVAGGMLSENKAKDIKGMYNYYVPLRGHDEKTAEDVYDYTSVMGTFFSNPMISAKGRKSRADDPFAFVFQMAQTSINTANMNTLKQGILRIAKYKDSKGLMSADNTWYVSTGEVDENGRTIWEPSYPLYSDDFNQYKENIKDFNEKMLELKDKGLAKQSNAKFDIGGLFIKRSQKLEHVVRVFENGKEHNVYINATPDISRAINGENKIIPPKQISKIGKLTKMMAANMTSRNPAFIATNFARDIGYAESMVFVKENAKYHVQFNKNIPQSVVSLSKYLTGKADPVNNKYDRYAFEYFINGGKTGFTSMLELEQTKKKLNKDLSRIGKSDVWTSTQKGVEGFLDMLQIGNDIAENVSRLSVYITSRESGRDVARSISDSKEITVNFNRMGAGGMWSSLVRPLYLFMNAGIQGLSNFSKLAIKNKKKMAAISGTFALTGIIQPLLAYLAWGDDGEDKYMSIPEYTRRSNFIIPAGDGFIKIPISQELRVFHGIGDIAYTVFTGRKDITDGLMDVMNALSDVIPLDPMNANVGLSNVIVPDIIKPITQGEANKNFMGSPIYNRWPNPNDPGYEQVRTNKKGEPYSPEWLIETIRIIDHLSGGDGVKKGLISLNPDKVNHYAKGYVGGLYTLMSQTVDMPNKVGNLYSKDIPVVSRFYISDSDLSSVPYHIKQKYYEYGNKVEKASTELKKYREALKDKKGSVNILDFASKISERDKIVRTFESDLKKIESAEKDLKNYSGEKQKEKEKELAEMMTKWVDKFEQYNKGK